MRVLVVNCGSSSIKYQLFDMTDESVLAKGIAEKIGQDDAVLHHSHNGEKTSFNEPMPDHAAGLTLILGKLTDPDVGVIERIEDIDAIGHRVVHGGERFVDSTLIDEEVIRGIEANKELAPLHNPPNLTGIEAAEKALPNVPQVAVFDTSFHQTMPKEHFLYALPYDYYERLRIRRYGFHGTSHRFVTDRAAHMLGKPRDEVNLVTCHLGNGCSAAAIEGGKVTDTSLGFTPLEGLVMGTRSGDIDPAIIFYLHGREGLSCDEINTVLNKKSGLLGISGVSNDNRELEQAEKAGNERAGLARDIFCYRLKKYIGSYFAAIGELDAVVFTGGIGENSDDVRARTMEGMEALGFKLDPAANDGLRGKETDIAAADSPRRILVIPTNEELVIARDTVRLAGGRMRR
jgi:acetate kinase